MQEILNRLESEIKKRGLVEDQIAEILKQNRDVINRRIIQGYASVNIVDRERQRIPIFALKSAVEKFMKNAYYRPITIFHSDIVIGRILPFWTNPETGEKHGTEVNDTGWRILGDIRDDIDIANKVWDEVVKGKIRSFSIAGSSKDKVQKQEMGQPFEQINDLEIYEVTLAEIPVNSMSKFDILWGSNRVEY